MTFPEHLYQLRVVRRLKQKEVAATIGVSTLTYQRYEYGTSEPTLSKLIALADFYQLSLDDLACRDSCWKRRKVRKEHPDNGN